MKVYSLQKPNSRLDLRRAAELLITGSWCFDGSKRCHTVRCEPYEVELSSVGELHDIMFDYAGHTTFLGKNARELWLDLMAVADCRSIVPSKNKNVSASFFDEFLNIDYKILEPKLSLKIDKEASFASSVKYCKMCGKSRIVLSKSRIVFRTPMRKIQVPFIFTATELGPNSKPVFLTEAGREAIGLLFENVVDVKEVGLIDFETL